MKIITAEQAARLIKSGDTVALSGFELACANEEVMIALEKQFLAENTPQNLTIMHASCLGDRKTKGMSHLSYPGLLKRWIGGIVMASSPKLSEMIQNDECEAYNLPQGVITQLYREIAAKRPGVITKVGLGTFVDPRVEGGKMSASTTEDMVKVLELDGQEWLYYPSFPIQVGLIRGTTIDEKGNLTLDKEGLHMEVLPIAQAVHNAGGIVIAQVEQIAKAGSLNPKAVRIPGILIDYAVVSKPENHFQTGTTYYNPAFSGEIKVPLDSVPTLPLDERKVIARRAAMELEPKTVLNLGVGIPVNVSIIAAEEGVTDQLILTTEAGSVGGVPAGLKDFGHAYNSEAIVEHHAQFDFYDGGGLDLSVLGLAEADQFGNVNVSKLGSRVIGCGGFINISQTAKKIIFTGTFTAGGLDVAIEDGKLTIKQEGKNKKFVANVNQITFSGQYAAKGAQKVMFVTERAVFELKNGKLCLIEIAPGIDLQKDILAQMAFTPEIATDLKIMPADIFKENWNKLSSIISKKQSKGEQS